MTTINDIFNLQTIKDSFRILSEHKCDLDTDAGVIKRLNDEYNFYVAVNRECDKAGIARHFDVGMPEDMDNKHKDIGDASANKPQNQHHKPKKK